MANATSATLSPLAPASSLRERVEEAIAAAIVSGQMPPGQVFSAPTLAARFGVSATPVREAMLNLAKRGMVDIVRNKGFRVTAVSEDDLRAIVDVRQLLEAPAVRRLAGKVPAADLKRLRTLAREIVRGAEVADLARYLQADTAFHLSMLELAGNPRLLAIVAELRSQTRLTGLASLVATEELLSSAREHLDLLDLLEAGDAEATERLMVRHVGHVLGWWAGHPED